MEERRQSLLKERVRVFPVDLSLGLISFDIIKERIVVWEMDNRVYSPVRSEPLVVVNQAYGPPQKAQKDTYAVKSPVGSLTDQMGRTTLC